MDFLPNPGVVDPAMKIFALDSTPGGPGMFLSGNADAAAGGLQNLGGDWRAGAVAVGAERLPIRWSLGWLQDTVRQRLHRPDRTSDVRPVHADRWQGREPVVTTPAAVSALVSEINKKQR